LIIDEIAATNKTGVLQEFAAHLQAKGKVKDAEELLRVLLERESLGSTGIGDGIAIPHGKLVNIPGMIVAFGRSRTGIDYQSLDHEPAYLFFLLVTPANKPGDHLKTLARISRILKNPSLRNSLRRASSRAEIQKTICEEDSKYPHQ
jgi:PTS system nitrogen regulatory IIA component